VANLRVFISSTAYDLGVLRSSLRAFIAGLGYDAVLSDYSDVIYDPREHAHKSCLAEVQTCDMVVLIIGSRFGSTLNARVLETSLHDLDATQLIQDPGSTTISVTQAEALCAAARKIPLFSFVDAGVFHDYSVYQRNKGKEFAKEIAYAAISQPGTAEYIFNFIDYLQGRSFNNAVVTFDRMEDVTSHLQKQWAGLFQRLLSEARDGRDESGRIDRLADQFQDLKAAMLATVGDASSRETARAVIRSRRLVDFLRSLPNPGEPLRDAFVSGELNFVDLLESTAGVIGIEDPDDSERDRFAGAILRTKDGADLECRFSRSFIDRLEADWQNLRTVTAAERAAVFDALVDSDDRFPRMVRRLPSGQTEEGANISLDAPVRVPEHQVQSDLVNESSRLAPVATEAGRSDGSMDAAG